VSQASANPEQRTKGRAAIGFAEIIRLVVQSIWRLSVIYGIARVGPGLRPPRYPGGLPAIGGVVANPGVRGYLYGNVVAAATFILY